MDRRSESLAFLIFCALGVFFSYFIYGLLQETITKTRYGLRRIEFTYIKPMLFLQCLINALFAQAALRYWREKRSTISQKSYALCGLSYIGAMFSSNASLRFVSYPTQVIGKSIKPIPVMLLSVLWAKQRYPLKKYIFVGLITTGVVMFMYKEGTSVQSKTNFGWGELLLLVSLGLDGLTGGMQEDFRSRGHVGPYTMMRNLNLWSLVYLGLVILLTGEVMPFVAFVRRFPNVASNILLFGIVSAIGQMFIYTTIVHFGPLMCSIITTTRKFFTVLASVVIFGHALSRLQMLGAALVFTGLLADQVYGKSKKRPNALNASAASSCNHSNLSNSSVLLDAKDTVSKKHS
uniref:Solute carrier family 35 member B1 n=2 Tax=Schistocephalus solidus TaxID=70667 RepID=A0A0X3PCI3_SCHSO